MPVTIYLLGHFPVGSRCTHWPSRSCPCLVYASPSWRVFYSAPFGKKRNRCVLLQVKSLYIKIYGPPKVLGYYKIKIKKHRSYLQFPEFGHPVLRVCKQRELSWMQHHERWKREGTPHPAPFLLQSTWLILCGLILGCVCGLRSWMVDSRKWLAEKAVSPCDWMDGSSLQETAALWAKT